MVLHNKCCNPTFRRVWGWYSHSQNGDLGVFRDSQSSEFDFKGQNTSSWSVFYIIGNLSKCRCWKWLGWAIWTSTPQVMVKRKVGSQIAVWLLTTKSQESTWPWCVQVVCDTPLESCQRELQVCFRPYPNRRSEQRIMSSQSHESPNQDSFGTPLWESWDKKPFGCRCRGQIKRILYGGRWWFSMSPDRGETCESRVTRALS